MMKCSNVFEHALCLSELVSSWKKLKFISDSLAKHSTKVFTKIGTRARFRINRICISNQSKIRWSRRRNNPANQGRMCKFIEFSKKTDFKCKHDRHTGRTFNPLCLIRPCMSSCSLLFKLICTLCVLEIEKIVFQNNFHTLLVYRSCMPKTNKKQTTMLEMKKIKVTELGILS